MKSCDIQTLNVWISHEVEESREEGVGRGISPRHMKVYNVHYELSFIKGGSSVYLLNKNTKKNTIYVMVII